MSEYEKELTNYIENMERNCESIEIEVDLLEHEIKAKKRQLEIHNLNLKTARQTVGMAKTRLAEDV